MRIGIIGSGLAASTLAAMLVSVPGITVHAYDRLPPEDAAAGDMGLALAPNALKALRLHLPARHAALQAVGLPWRHWSVALANGRPLCDLGLIEVAEEPGLRLHRLALHRLMRAPAAPVTRFGLELVAVEEDAVSRLVPVLRAPDGALLRPRGYDWLVAADGRRSRLRAVVAGRAMPVLHGLALGRLLVPEAGDCPHDDYGEWFNGNARLLSYRLPDGAALIAGAFPLAATAEAGLPPEVRTAAWQRALYTPEAGGACSAVAWMCERLAAGAAAIRWSRPVDLPLCRTASDGRVLLLGEAAQVTLPVLGQGPSQAIEDGVVAGTVLRRGGMPEDVAAWRDTRANFVHRLSLEAAEGLFPGADPVTAALALGSPEFLAKLRRLFTDVPRPEDFNL